MNKFFCITAHGMNLLPRRMEAFENVFKNWGGETYNITFHGHYPGKLKEYNSATPEHWLSNITDAFEHYKKNFSHLPLYYLGYSLGGLVGVSYLQQNQEFKKYLKKMVLVAPALAPRDYLIWIARTTGYPNLPIPTLNIKNYNVHSWSSVQVNNEIYKLIQKLNPPRESEALVLLNPKDELISYQKTVEFIADHKLTNWKILKIQPQRSWLKPIPQHLFIDEKTMGKKMWEDSQREIFKFLNENLN